ncbi:MAG: SUMF1/EgtB/PvdO family nonheme iron enzyme [Cyanobacteria bacterium P01_A01_bin.40]
MSGKIISNEEAAQKAAALNEQVEVAGGVAWIGENIPQEGPRVQVFVPTFSIDRYAVSNRQFDLFRKAGGYQQPELWEPSIYEWIQREGITASAFQDDESFNAPDQPITGISYYEAKAFAKWIGGRLPTEVEWEKSARGTDERRFPWGNSEPNLDQANFSPNFIPLRRNTVSVYDFPTGDSPYGCRQMVGNLFEWCLDHFHTDTTVRRSLNKQLVEDRFSSRIVLKGGCWFSGSNRLRISTRWSFIPTLRDNILGFRVAYGDLMTKH